MKLLTSLFLFAGVDANADCLASTLESINQSHDLPYVGGQITVPKSHWATSGQSDNLRVAYYHRKGIDWSQTEPVVFISGGPNVSYAAHFRSMDELFYAAVGEKKTALVFFDHRGVGCSSSIDPNDTLYKLEEIKLYNSESIAVDLEYLRQHLFPNKKINLFAFSYGMLVAARYVGYFPSSVGKVTAFGPVLHESMSDFFLYRMIAQNQKLSGFQALLGDLDLHAVFEKISSSQGARYCIGATPLSPAICGLPLLDSILAGLGQGYRDLFGGLNSRGQSIKGLLQAFLDSLVTDTYDSNSLRFLEAAEQNLKWFRDQRSYFVSGIWATELPNYGNPFYDCEVAYHDYSAMGLAYDHLAIDECRLINHGKPPTLMAYLEEQFYSGSHQFNWLSQEALGNQLISYKIPMTLVFGDQDSLAQANSFYNLDLNPYADIIHLEGYGHSGYRLSPELMQIVAE